jgi:hypothetical protein
MKSAETTTRGPEITPQRLADALAYVNHLAESAQAFQATELGDALVLARSSLMELQLLQAEQGNIDHLCPTMGRIGDLVLEVKEEIEQLRISN